MFEDTRRCWSFFSRFLGLLFGWFWVVHHCVLDEVFTSRSHNRLFHGVCFPTFLEGFVPVGRVVLGVHCTKEHVAAEPYLDNVIGVGNRSG